MVIRIQKTSSAPKFSDNPHKKKSFQFWKNQIRLICPGRQPADGNAVPFYCISLFIVFTQIKEYRIE